MYSLLQHAALRELILAEGPSLLAAGLVTELFCKFHSFTLECLAFLALWYTFGRLAATFR